MLPRNIPHFVEKILIFITFFLLFVFPNTFREIKVVLLSVLFVRACLYIKTVNKIIGVFLSLSFVVTLLYLEVGLAKAKQPDDVLFQVLVVYIATPILWVVLLQYCFSRFSTEAIIKYLNIYMLLGCLSVFVAFLLYQMKAIHLLQYVIESPNMTLTPKGLIEMKLHVYGSLIFFFAAYFQLKNKYAKMHYYMWGLLILVTAVMSGRTALLLSVFFGVLFLLKVNFSYKSLGLFGGVCVLLVFGTFILELFGIELYGMLQESIEKLQSGGGDERREQFVALLDGIVQNPMGAGHGIGVGYVRNTNFPWRYEILPLALWYRVGLLGLIVYSLPCFYSLWKYIILREKNDYDNYMLAGYLAIIIATCTNPYLESFEFNVFYVIPFVYFLSRSNEKGVVFNEVCR